MTKMIKRLRCLTCSHVITQSNKLNGCLCDSDSPTWCALDGERVIALSCSLYTTWSVQDLDDIDQ